MKAEKMLKKLDYLKDKETHYGALISYTKYCIDGCCIYNELIFYKNGFSTDETFISLDLLNAINKQIEELGWLDEQS